MAGPSAPCWCTRGRYWRVQSTRFTAPRTRPPHAEMQAIRKASHALGQARLDGAEIYASGHPCPMCLAAMHLCGIERAWFAYDNAEGEPYGLSTAAVYAQMARPPQQQSLPLRALKPSGEAGLYHEWKQANAQ
ncbi:deaminase [Pseudomonas putida]|nr:deaminase [Pseudomonas putida]